MLDRIRVRKAAQHNLKSIDVDLPRNRLIVVTGPSGSGKSSLAFDTLFAEGQRRYIECLSAYARQYIEMLEKPNVESIEGISPAVSIDQRTISLNPRSTVGTVTETYDFLRLLFARAGTPHCPRCGREVSSQTRDQIFNRLLEDFRGEKIRVMAPVVRGRKGEYGHLFDRMRRKGYLRARVDGEFRELEDETLLPKNLRHDIEILIDAFRVGAGENDRLAEAVDRALELAGSDLLILREEGEEVVYSLSLICPYCRISLPDLEPRSFSFNSPYGACPACHGLGYRTRMNERGDYEVTGEICPRCRGSRLKPESLAVRIGGRNISDLSFLPVERLSGFLGDLSFSGARAEIAGRILKEILSRLEIVGRLGMGYLQLSRSTASLSGGEARRIRLAAQVGVRLRGVLYVLDEPTIGLHQRDNTRLIDLLRDLRDQGNSVVVVEHDEQTIRSADFVLDLGPGAGEKGGEKVTEGPVEKVLGSESSLTAQYLDGRLKIPFPEKRRRPAGWLTVHGAAEHNLKEIDVRIPLGVMTVVTGVSGSGKSTLVDDILYRELANRFHKARFKAGRHRGISGLEQIDKVISVDQKPIGRTPRSNPATFTGLFTSLRQLFAMTQEARIRAYPPGRFSFNVAGGRCEECRGAGAKKIEMHFLPDVFVTCDRCGGSRYNRETLAVRFKGRHIADYLEMTVDDAFEVLSGHPALRRKLDVLRRVGLGYLRLGQPAPTLSGGEAQRIKLTRELGRRDTGRTLYILDEPTTGLHFDDVRKLLAVLDELVELGNTVLVIEHNLDVIRFCDYIIDLGPECGDKGGEIVAAGSPEEVSLCDGSHTGRFLRRALETGGSG
jgi:excinuclease ABC subunit A